MAIASAREIILEVEPQIIRMHRFIEWGLVALCVISLFIYLLHSLAAEKYVALYLTLLKKLPIFLGN